MFSTLTLFGSLACVSLAVTLWQVCVGFRFPLGRRTAGRPYLPPITILKPLKGCDSETEGCLRSWLTQDYAGSLQIIFGVASSDDPVCGLVRRLMAQHPERSAQLLVCSERIGANAKVSQLVQLDRLAEHDVVCVSDADVWVAPDFLTHAVRPLGDSRVGVVSCLYRMTNHEGWAMRWEAFGVNADFWSQVLQSLSLKPMHFALGAVMITTHVRLRSLGGFNALSDQLADDYELGNRLARAGARIVLSPEVVECRSARLCFKEVWRHQLRWARTIRVCQPVPVFFSIVGNASLWPLVWLATAHNGSVALMALGCLLVRLLGGALLEHRFTGHLRASRWGMAMVKDLFQVFLWTLSFSGKQVTWSGARYRLEEGGKLIPLVELEAK